MITWDELEQSYYCADCDAYMTETKTGYVCPCCEHSIGSHEAAIIRAFSCIRNRLRIHSKQEEIVIEYAITINEEIVTNMPIRQTSACGSIDIGKFSGCIKWINDMRKPISVQGITTYYDKENMPCIEQWIIDQETCDKAKIYCINADIDNLNKTL